MKNKTSKDAASEKPFEAKVKSKTAMAAAKMDGWRKTGKSSKGDKLGGKC